MKSLLSKIIVVKSPELKIIQTKMIYQIRNVEWIGTNLNNK